MAKIKRDLQPGVKYRGYGVLNEYGEFEFIPEETGKNKGKRKLIKQGNDFSVAETRDLVIVHITKQKNANLTRLQFLNNYLETVNETLKILGDYVV